MKPSTTAREPKRVHLRVRPSKTPPKFQEKTPRETEKERNGGGRGGKKAKFWAVRGRGPAEGCPTSGGLAQGGPGESKPTTTTTTKTTRTPNPAVAKSTGSLPAAVRRALNAALVNVFPYRTCRELPTLRQVVESDGWMFEVTVLKTAASHGPSGRYVLADPRSQRLLVLVKSTRKTQSVQVHKPTSDSAKIYTPYRQYFAPTLLPKHIESEIADPKKAAKAAAMNAAIPSQLESAAEAVKHATRMAGHSCCIAKKHYMLESGDPAADACTAKAYVDFFKGPLPPLTQEQDASELHRTTAAILTDFKRLARSDAPSSSKLAADTTQNNRRSKKLREQLKKTKVKKKQGGEARARPNGCGARR